MLLSRCGQARGPVVASGGRRIPQFRVVSRGYERDAVETHHLTTDDLADLTGADATAAQVQQWVNKIHEARVVVVGQRGAA
jgi:hypothetical protein